MNPINKLGKAIKERNWEGVASVYKVLSGETIDVEVSDDTSVKLQLLNQFAEFLQGDTPSPDLIGDEPDESDEPKVIKKKPGRKPKTITKPAPKKKPKNKNDDDEMRFITDDDLPDNDPLRKASKKLAKIARRKVARVEPQYAECSSCHKEVLSSDISNHKLDGTTQGICNKCLTNNNRK